MLMGAHTSPPFFKEKRKKLACLKQVTLRIYRIEISTQLGMFSFKECFMHLAWSCREMLQKNGLLHLMEWILQIIIY